MMNNTAWGQELTKTSPILEATMIAMVPKQGIRLTIESALREAGRPLQPDALDRFLGTFSSSFPSTACGGTSISSITRAASPRLSNAAAAAAGGANGGSIAARVTAGSRRQRVDDVSSSDSRSRDTSFSTQGSASSAGNPSAAARANVAPSSGTFRLVSKRDLREYDRSIVVVEYTADDTLEGLMITKLKNYDLKHFWIAYLESNGEYDVWKPDRSQRLGTGEISKVEKILGETLNGMVIFAGKKNVRG